MPMLAWSSDWRKKKHLLLTFYQRLCKSEGILSACGGGTEPHRATPAFCTSFPLWVTVFPKIYPRSIFVVTPNAFSLWIYGRPRSCQRIKSNKRRVKRSGQPRPGVNVKSLTKGQLLKVYVNRRKKNADEDRIKDWLTKPWASLRDMLAHSRHSKPCLDDFVGWPTILVCLGYMSFSVKIEKAPGKLG